jgi:hypothetical protein
MNVFISWSGDRSLAVAQALRDWLPNVIQALEPWLSASDIEQGTRWSTEVSLQLQESRVGIVCLTPENLREPWILFEAGALSKTIANTFVCTYLIDLEITDVSWPLAMFQATKADKEPTRKLLQSINKALEKKALTEARLDEIFDVWWPKLEEKLAAIPKPAPSEKHQPNERTLLSELISLARSQAQVSDEAITLLRKMQFVRDVGRQPSIQPDSDLARFMSRILSLAPLKTDEQGRHYRDKTLFAEGGPVFEWQGITPPKRLGWKFSVDELEKLFGEERVVLSKDQATYREYVGAEAF